MNYEKWQDIMGNIKDNFEIEEQGKKEVDEIRKKEFVVFQSPLGKVKLELLIQPVILDKKTTYSQRVGADVKVDYIYSDKEKSYKMTAFKWNEASEDWQEIDGSAFE